MAFFSPMMRSDINIYERKRPQQRSRSLTRPSQIQIAPKLSGKESTSLDSLLDKQKHLMLMRERRQQRRNQRRNTLNFRKISVITETDEENEDSLDSLTQDFIVNTQMTPKTPITTIRESSEEENHPPVVTSQKSTSSNSSTTSSDSDKKKKSVIAMFNEWVRNHSLKRRKSKEGEEK